MAGHPSEHRCHISTRHSSEDGPMAHLVPKCLLPSTWHRGIASGESVNVEQIPLKLCQKEMKEMTQIKEKEALLSQKSSHLYPQFNGLIFGGLGTIPC